MDATLPEAKALPRRFPGKPRIALAVKVPGPGGDGFLFPEEDRLLSPRAAVKRRREFGLGRAAAHEAIASLLGVSSRPVGKGEHGEPLWPPGLVGSITHCGDTALAAVGRRADTAGIGIDLEQLSRATARDISGRVCTARERAWVREAGGPAEERLRVRMLFSAKESVYKAFFPAGGVFLGFGDAELRWDARERAFHGSLLRGAGAPFPAGTPFRVGCRRTREFVFTFLCLPPAG